MSRPQVFPNRSLPLDGPATMENFEAIERGIGNLEANGTVSTSESVIGGSIIMAYNAADQTLSPNEQVVLDTFDTRWGAQGAWTINGSGGLVVPTAGTYRITVNAGYYAGTGLVRTYLASGGGTNYFAEQDCYTSAAATAISFSTVWPLGAGDSIGLFGGLAGTTIDIKAGPPDSAFTAVIVEAL